MPKVEVHHVIEPTVGAEVHALLDAAEQAAGRQPLSDHLAVDLARGGAAGFVAATSTDASGRVVGYAQASAGNANYAMELVVHPDRLDETGPIGGTLVGAAIAAIAEQGGGLVNWLVPSPIGAHEEIADEFGMRRTRTLHQMTRSLPTGLDVAIDTRSIVVGADDDAWLAVNNRAFAGHGEQGGWTPETLRRRQAEDWFDAGDVRIHERDGRLAAFCWTKVHPATGRLPELGEIYVMAVDPDFHGLGLGRQITLAGLERLSDRGMTTGMLWVDAENAAARGLYEGLGFSMVATTVAFTSVVPPATRRPEPRTTRS